MAHIILFGGLAAPPNLIYNEMAAVTAAKVLPQYINLPVEKKEDQIFVSHWSSDAVEPWTFFKGMGDEVRVQIRGLLLVITYGQEEFRVSWRWTDKLIFLIILRNIALKSKCISTSFLHDDDDPTLVLELHPIKKDVAKSEDKKLAYDVTMRRICLPAVERRHPLQSGATCTPRQ